MSEFNFEQAQKAYLDFLQADYAGFSDRVAGASNFSASVEAGQRYGRVVTSSGSSRSAHSFLVLQDYTTPKGLVLKQGDVLKAASWKTPALNFVRGNVFNPPTYFRTVRWSGV